MAIKTNSRTLFDVMTEEVERARDGKIVGVLPNERMYSKMIEESLGLYASGLISSYELLLRMNHYAYTQVETETCN